MSGELVTSKVQIGQSAVAANNFVLRTPGAPDGSLSIHRGSVGAEGVEVLRVNADGGVSLFGPIFRVTLAANQALLDAQFTKIIFGLETFDSSNAYDHTTGRFNPKVAGYYQINAGVVVNTAASANTINTIYKNNALYSLGGRVPTMISDETGLVCTDLVYLNGDTDFIDIRAYTDGGAGYISSAHFSGYLVRAA